MAARVVSRSYSSGILKNGNRIAVQKVNVQIFHDIFMAFRRQQVIRLIILKIIVKMRTNIRSNCVMLFKAYVKCVWRLRCVPFHENFGFELFIENLQ